MPKFPRRKELSVVDYLEEPSGRSFRDRLIAQQKPSENVTTPRHKYYWWDRYNAVEIAMTAVESGLRDLFFQRYPNAFGFEASMERAAEQDRAMIRERAEAEKDRPAPRQSRPHMHSERDDEAGILSWIFFSQAMGEQKPGRR
ncbi:hypothetical protein [Chelativorans salis]|uniref:Uncharacterized protein n=1 Tax=Chelativorans salis TaxID=2978478 RepID=A0ABT2LMU7_9HYPH|nr:hypothetical protein [Chelativorans sp. EGI FJ00035]MCT7375729.1 hypothetical protein [Chelativorans sp. EGI FJ00035]